MTDQFSNFPGSKGLVSNLQVQATIHYGYSLPKESLNNLIAAAKTEELRGWFLLAQGAVEARLEGSSVAIARFVTHWRRLLASERVHSFRVTIGPVQGGFPRVKVFRDAKSLETFQRQMLKEEEKQPEELDKIRDLVPESFKILAEKLGIDQTRLKNVFEEARKLPSEGIYEHLVEKLQELTDVDLSQFHVTFLKDAAQLTSEEKKVAETDFPPSPAPLVVTELEELYAALGPTEREYLSCAEFNNLMSVRILSPRRITERLKMEPKIAERVRTAANFAALKGIDVRVAVSLAKSDITLERIATASHTKIQGILQATAQVSGNKLEESLTSMPRITWLQKEAKQILEMLRTFDDIQDLVRISKVFSIRWAGELPSDRTIPLPKGATVRLVLRYQCEKPLINQIRELRIHYLRKESLNQLLEIASEVGGELADRMQRIKAGAGLINTDLIEHPGNRIVLASVNPTAQGEVEFFMPKGIIEAFAGKSELFFEIDYTGYIGEYWVEIKNRLTNDDVQIVATKSTMVATEFVDPTLETPTGNWEIPSESATESEAGSPEPATESEAVLRPEMPEVEVVIQTPTFTIDPCGSIDPLPAGPAHLWPENSYTLYGTVISPLQRFQNTIITYDQEFESINTLLTDFDIGSDLRKKWYDLYLQCARPCVPVPTYPPLMDQKQVFDKHHGDVWAIAGIKAPAALISGSDHQGPDITWWQYPHVFFVYGNYAASANFSGLGSQAMVDLGCEFWDLPLDELFYRSNTLRMLLREKRTRIQSLLDNGQTDPQDRRKLPPNEDRTDLPDVVFFHEVGRARLESIKPFLEHRGILHEIDRVLPILDELSQSVNYHFLRYRTLSVLAYLNQAHQSLEYEQSTIALGYYYSAKKLLDQILDRDIDFIMQLPALDGRYPELAGGYYFHRLMSIDDAFEPLADPADDALLDRLEVICVAAVLLGPWIPEVVALLQAMIGTERISILDGNIKGNTLEDALVYLRDFVIPACRGETLLNRAQWISSNQSPLDYRDAITNFKNAAEYISKEEKNSIVSHFLWLRMARAYLLQGYDQYAYGEEPWSEAFATLGKAVDVAYGYKQQIRIPTLLSHEGELVQNPLVLALKIEACNYRENIKALVNPLGYSKHHISKLRFNRLLQQADTAAGHLEAAEERYITFREKAESAHEHSTQISDRKEAAEEEAQQAGDIVGQQKAELAKAELELGAMHHRLQNAREALTTFSQMMNARQILGFADSVFTSRPVSGAVSTLNIYTNDRFQRLQLQHNVSELEVAVNIAGQNTVVAQRALASAHALKRLMDLKVATATDAERFDINKEFNYARWYALAEEMHDIVRYRRRSALQSIYLAQQSFCFMTDIDVHVVDYYNFTTNRSLAQRRTYLLGQYIRDAITELRRYWQDYLDSPGATYQGQENTPAGTLALTEPIALHQASAYYNVDPLQFERMKFNEGGTIDFEIRLDQLDCRTNGTYHRLVEDVEVFIDSGYRPVEGFRVRLSNSPYSIVRIRDLGDQLTTEELLIDDWVASQGLGFKTLIKPQSSETQIITGPCEENPNFVYSTGPVSTDRLRPFEYNGLAQRWRLEMRHGENLPLRGHWQDIGNIFVRFKYSHFHDNVRGLDPLHQGQCPGRGKGSVTVLEVYNNFFTPGRPPFSSEDRIATVQFKPEDFPAYHRTNPTLLNLGILFVPMPGSSTVTNSPIHFYLSFDQYADSSGTPIEVAADTTFVTGGQFVIHDPDDFPSNPEEAADTTADTVPLAEGHIATSDTSDPSNPLNVFVDRDTKDYIITPWLLLIQEKSGTLVGATFTLRVNLTENPNFDFSRLSHVLMYFEYRYESRAIQF